MGKTVVIGFFIFFALFAFGIARRNLSVKDVQAKNGAKHEIAVGCETTGIAVIKILAATPVSITGTDTGLEYDESDIDVSQYFTIDSNAGTAVYSLVSKETDGSVTGEGTLDGSILNIKNT